MISRGYFIGEIVDSLAIVSQQVNVRCRLGLTDLNKYLEDFFKNVLNETLSLNLVNMNEDRSNAPGIDLIDQTNDIAFQITSTKTSQKVNDTLEAVSKLDTIPKDIIVLIIGKKQGSYTLDEDLCSKYGFIQEDNIWDVDSVCKKLIGLPIDTLQTIHSQVSKELARVKIELEIPNEAGEYPTQLQDFIEKIPTPTLTDFSHYFQFHKSQHTEFDLSIDQVQDDFQELIIGLKKLPRITREFYAFLLKDRLDDDGMSIRMNFVRLQHICRFPNYMNEVSLLVEYGFLSFDPDIEMEDGIQKGPYLFLINMGKSEYFLNELLDFHDNKELCFRNPIVNLNFLDYGERVSS